MRRPTSLGTRRELMATIAERYQTANRQEKKAILDEFVKLTGYHRKHAIRVLRRKQMTALRSVGKRVYQEVVEEALIVLWEAADRICGKRLKALLPTPIEAMERHAHLQLDETVRGLLLSISAATSGLRCSRRSAQFGY